MQAAGARTLYELQHKDAPYHDGWFRSWAKEPSPSHPFHFSDGVRIWVAREDLNPEDDFLGSVALHQQIGRKEAEGERADDVAGEL